MTSSRLSGSIWALGLVSLFMDVSSEIVHGLLPLFLVSVLGAGMTTVGLLEGMAEGTALVLKVFSGPFSDWIGRRKPLVVIGYTMGALSKPLFAMATSIPMVFGARFFDRVGKGIREAPRDAMIADLVPLGSRGRAFGLRQSLDTIGAFVGPMLAIWLMWLTSNDYRTTFWVAVIPGFIAVAILVFGVREKRMERREAARPIRPRDLKGFSASFWFTVAVGTIFQLARFSEAFLILRARDVGLALELAPVVLIVMNVVYALSSYPAGYLSDRIRREWFLLGGFLVLFISDLILGFGEGLTAIFWGIVLWGLHLGLTQGILTAEVADTCPEDRRGTAYGLFNLFSAVALLLASLIAGILWDRMGPKVTFTAAAALSLLSFVLFLPIIHSVISLERQKWR